MPNPAIIPETEIANRLVAGGLSLTLATNLFVCPLMPPSDLIPRECTFAFASQPGPPPKMYFGVSPTREDFREFWVQVVHRASPDAWTTGLAKSRAIFAALHRVTPSGTGYFSIHCRDADPVFMGLDNLECPRWTINAVLWYKG